jgi:hypothetical protein
MLRGAFDAQLADLHVALPARVEKYYPTKLAVDVKPLLRRADVAEDGARTTVEYPVIPSVPVLFPGSGAYRLTFPITKGDLVLLVFAETSIDKWLRVEKLLDPGDDRRHSLNDAIAIPGLRSFKGVNVAGNTGAALEGPDIRLGSHNASDPVALKSDLQEIYDAINGAGTTPNDGGATFKAAILAALVAAGFPQASTKVKAE